MIHKNKFNSRKIIYASRTNGRFSAEPMPRIYDYRLWIFWWIKLLLLHIPIRLFCLMDSSHDLHHRCPVSKEWPNAEYARMRDIEANCPGWPAYTEIWGIFAMLDLVFESLSNGEV